MAFDNRKLRGRIVEKFGTLGAFSDAMKMNRSTMSARFNGMHEWRQSDIAKACELLGIETADIPAYFLTDVVKSSERREKPEGEENDV